MFFLWYFTICTSLLKHTFLDQGISFYLFNSFALPSQNSCLCYLFKKKKSSFHYIYIPIVILIAVNLGCFERPRVIASTESI